MTDKYIYILIYGLILVTGLINYKKYNHNFLLKLWLYFLVYSFLTEVIAVYVIFNLKLRATFIYNLWNIINTIFYLIFFSLIIKDFKNKRIVFGILLTFVTYTLIDTLFYKNIMVNLLSINFIIGMLVVVIAIMFYYVDLINSDAILSIHKSLFFWISTGVLIFNIGSLPVCVIGELIDWQGVFNYIILILNIFMAISFIIGFIVSRKKNNL